MKKFCLRHGFWIVFLIFGVLGHPLFLPAGETTTDAPVSKTTLKAE
ncbi:MAG: hypothetical protein OS130_07815 [Thermodesulfobacteriota bacterium]|nr:MAG: hypothetical protein OS130_07815 [Thermodesulfobacteriota bacterium]